jgi:predicted ATPase with chaperone activity
VDNLRPVQASGEAFDHLVFEEEQKNLVLTFVRNHEQSERSNDDVIAGKGKDIKDIRNRYFIIDITTGQGLTILLSGPPGTGKTLTVESSG